MSKQLNVRSDRDWQALCSEFNICKRRLKSKEEGLLILSKELDTIRGERNEYKLMAEQLREKYHGQKRKYEERERALGLWSPDNDHVAERRSHSLAQLLSEARAQNKKLQHESEDLKQKLAEAHGDIKLLRENIARQRIGDEGVGARHFPAHEREELVKQIEELREQTVTLERDLTAKVDDEEEILSEKEHFRHKAERLNQELNYILGGDEKRIVDIDALCMESQYLKERLKQCQEEKELAHQNLAKYKNALDRRRGKGTMKLGGNRTGGVVISQKQVQQLLAEGKGTGIPATPSSVADLQNLASALLDTVNDKNLALNHQRSTNKILGKRVAELEKKLKTLEVSGLWNLPQGQLKGKTLAKVIAENEEMKGGIKALTPRQAPSSDHESEDDLTPPSSSQTSPPSSSQTSPPSSSQTSPSHGNKCPTAVLSSDTDSLISIELDTQSVLDDSASVSDSLHSEKTEELSISDSLLSDKSERLPTTTELGEHVDESNDLKCVSQETSNEPDKVDELYDAQRLSTTDDDVKKEAVAMGNSVVVATAQAESDENKIIKNDIANQNIKCTEIEESKCELDAVNDTSLSNQVCSSNIVDTEPDQNTLEEKPGENPFGEEESIKPIKDEPDLNPFKEEPGPNPFNEEPGPNPFENEQGPNPFDEEPGPNPFDEEPGPNPFDEPDPNPFDDQPGSNQFPDNKDNSDVTQSSNPFLESIDLNKNQETLNEVGELIEDIFDDVTNKIASQKMATESQHTAGTPARPSSPLLNKKPPPPLPATPPAANVEV